MRYLTAIEAAKRIGVAEKTVRLWVKEGKLDAHHPAKNRLAIAESDVERLAQERRLYYSTQPNMPSIIHTQPDISALEARIAELESKVASLEHTIHTLTHPYVPSHVPTTKDTYQPQQSPRNRNVGAKKGTLPEGCILCSEFAKQHGIPRETMRDYLLLGIGPGSVPGELSDPMLPVKEQIDYSERPKPGRAKEVERYFDSSQKEKALEILKRHGKLQ